jgi:hypothetical protein
MKNKVVMKKRTLIIVALAISIILYAAGLFSGLSFSKYVEQKIKATTEQDISVLEDYIKSLDSDLQSIQIQERFISSLNENDSCKFIDVYFSHLKQNLGYFWELLPSRLEQYERERELSANYLELKQKYIILSLRAWIISDANYKKCNTDLVPILYFYSTDCANCVEQGEVLDSLKDDLLELNKTAIVFTIDYNYPEPALELIKEYYQVNAVPAIVVNNKVLQGRLFSKNEILLNLKGNLVGKK